MILRLGKLQIHADGAAGFGDVQELSYADFSKSVSSQALSERVPVCGVVELTNRCNLNCVHCYTKNIEQGRELSTSEWKSVLDAVASEGCLWLLLTGGEPLLRIDFKELYKYAVERGMMVTVFTNAVLLDEETLELFHSHRPFAVEITLHALDRARYEAVTRVPGSFEQCIGAIKRLVESGVPLRLKSVGLKENKDQLVAVRDFADGLGVQYRFDCAVHPKLNGDCAPLEHRLEVDEIIQIELNMPGHLTGLCEMVRREKLRKPGDKLFQCSAGLNSFHIEADGSLVFCSMVRESKWNILEKGFRRGWDEFYRPFHAMMRERDGECAQCELHSICAQCAGWSYLVSGDLESRVDFLCRLTRRRHRLLSMVGETL